MPVLPLKASTLMLNADGSVYHLNLLPEDIADTIFLVGDPERVSKVSRHFDQIEVNKHKREFVTHTGRIGNKRLTVLSTGIGSGNIDIVLNELDALVNIDLANRCVKEQLTSLNIVRMGTCGSLQADVPVDSLLLSDRAIAFDGFMQFYEQQQDQQFLQAVSQQFAPLPVVSNAYVGVIDSTLQDTFAPLCQQGITLTCSGFYGPQGRQLRADLAETDLFACAEAFSYQNQRIVNLEMETAAIYALGSLLGHRCCSISTVVANRIEATVSPDSAKAINRMIQQVLQVIV